MPYLIDNSKNLLQPLCLYLLRSKKLSVFKTINGKGKTLRLRAFVA